jgi:hypothetical protein
MDERQRIGMEKVATVTRNRKFSIPLAGVLPWHAACFIERIT